MTRYPGMRKGKGIRNMKWTNNTRGEGAAEKCQRPKLEKDFNGWQTSVAIVKRYKHTETQQKINLTFSLFFYSKYLCICANWEEKSDDKLAPVQGE